MYVYNEGDVVSLRYDGPVCLVAKIVEIEPLTLHDIIHLVLFDRLLEAGPRGYDQSGELRERTHVVPENLTESPHVIDAVAMTSTAFQGSDPEFLFNEEVSESERTGYAIWVAQRREAAERKGMIRYDVEGDEQTDGPAEDEVIDVEEEEPRDLDATADLEDEIETVVVEIQPWHSRVYDIPIQDILSEHEDVLTAGAFAETELGQVIRARREAGKSEIGSLIERLVLEGDYAAGQELLDFGDDAVPALAEALSISTELQPIEDICQILADIGTELSYDVIGAESERVAAEVDSSESARSVLRAFLYAVMLTGGTPEPLRSRINLIAGVVHEDLKGDVDAALSAVAEGGRDVNPEDEAPKSSDPFGSMM